MLRLTRFDTQRSNCVKTCKNVLKRVKPCQTVSECLKNRYLDSIQALDSNQSSSFWNKIKGTEYVIPVPMRPFDPSMFKFAHIQLQIHIYIYTYIYYIYKCQCIPLLRATTYPFHCWPAPLCPRWGIIAAWRHGACKEWHMGTQVADAGRRW